MGVAAGEGDTINQIQAFHVALEAAAKRGAGVLGCLEIEAWGRSYGARDLRRETWKTFADRFTPCEACIIHLSSQ